MKIEKYENNDKNYMKLGVYVKKIHNVHLIFNKQSIICVNKYIILIARHGVFSLQCGGKQYKFKEGSAIFLHLNTERELIFDDVSDEECWITMIEFDGSSMPGIQEYLEIPDLLRFIVAGQVLTSGLDEMVEVWGQKEYFRTSILLQKLLLSIKDTMRTDYKIYDMREIYEYIQEHYSEPIDLNHLAGIAGTSVSYFSRIFKENFGISPMVYVNEVRLHYARIMLSSTDMKVYEIAHRCGYDKFEYFCYVFKRYEGCTPSQYRNNYRHIHNWK